MATIFCFFNGEVRVQPTEMTFFLFMFKEFQRSDIILLPESKDQRFLTWPIGYYLKLYCYDKPDTKETCSVQKHCYNEACDRFLYITLPFRRLIRSLHVPAKALLIEWHLHTIIIHLSLTRFFIFMRFIFLSASVWLNIHIKTCVFKYAQIVCDVWIVRELIADVFASLIAALLSNMWKGWTKYGAGRCEVYLWMVAKQQCISGH